MLPCVTLKSKIVKKPALRVRVPYLKRASRPSLHVQICTMASKGLIQEHKHTMTSNNFGFRNI